VKEFMEHLEREHWAEFVDKVEETFFTLVPKSSSSSSSPAKGQPWKTWEGIGTDFVPAKVWEEIGPDKTIASLENATAYLTEPETIEGMDPDDIPRVVAVARDLLKIPIEWYAPPSSGKRGRESSGSPEIEEAEYERIREAAMRAPPARQRRFV